MNDKFKTLHPSINFAFFVGVMIISMAASHPAFLILSFVSATVYATLLKKKKIFSENLLYIFPILVIMTLLNPFFNHRGATILFYFNRNPVTLESFLYGGASAVKFGAVIMWFACYNEVMTSDKFMYLFGKAIPSLLLIFSMILRLVPNYTARLSVISNAQKSIGRDISNGNLRRKFKNGIRIVSIMTTWALESAVDTADSMKARGYGLNGRTSFSLFRFDSRDKAMLVIISAAFVLQSYGVFSADVQYYPTFESKPFTPLTFVSAAVFTLFCFFPVMFNLVETRRIHHYRNSHR